MARSRSLTALLLLYSLAQTLSAECTADRLALSGPLSIHGRQKTDLTWLVARDYARIQGRVWSDRTLPFGPTVYEMPVWQRVGVYGLELIGSGASAYGCAWVSAIGTWLSVPNWNWDTRTAAAATCWYAATNTLLTGSIAYGIGHGLDETGEWKAAGLGAFLGGLIGAPAFFIVGDAYSSPNRGKAITLAVIAAVIPPAVGAVVSLNIWKSDDGQ